MLNNKDIILAGDIGGTKTSIGIFSMGKKRPSLKYKVSYPSADYNNLEDIIDKFLAGSRIKPVQACFGVAGPVKNGNCKTTNLPWNISEKKIQKYFKLKKTVLINDLRAMACSVPFLTGSEVSRLNSIRSPGNGNISLIAPGTGLGVALLIYNNGEYLPVSSEGGHVDFAPNNDLESGLLRYLGKKYDHVSIERILSGEGLYSIFNYLISIGAYKSPKWLLKKIEEGDPAKVINEAAGTRRQKLCLKTIDIFISILGAAAGNLTLTGMTTGGVYLGGGIPPNLLWRLKKGIFMKSFTEKGRFKSILDRIPVKVILNDNAALLGAAIAGFNIPDD
ncbi:glucokinase [Thermodesulfobacteriota bacterium]